MSSTLTCLFPGSPPLNTDIAGIGVRISTYVQSLLTDKVYDQSFPFVIMNISVMVAALVLGFSPNSQISLQDGLVAWFFTFIPLFVLIMVGQKLRNRNKLHNAVKSSNWDLISNLVTLSIMYILHAAFSLSLFHHYKTFGNHPECNNAARAFIFGTHAVTNRWFIGLAIAYGIVLSLMFIPMLFKLLLLVIFLMTVREPRDEEERQEAEQQRKHVEKLAAEATPQADFEADYLWGFIAFSLLAIWIAFTEVTVGRNNFEPSDSPIWQFGQIFPMILLAVPLLNTARAVSEFIEDTPKRRERMKQDTAPKVRAGYFETIDKILDVPEEKEPEGKEIKEEITPPMELV
ncbi:hypothetical protein BJ912DRAFT_1044679 [Pholiota molesta]|nr:hypothetical protein BJ912DRAFT_1044679 [Pholiota molesta]